MQQKIVNNNIIILNSEAANPSLEDVSKVELKIATIYETLNPKPVITRFPDFTAILIPEVQVSIIIEKSRTIISDQNIGDSDRRDMLKFIQLVKGIVDILGRPTKGYGYNFSYEAENSNFNHFKDSLATKFIKPNARYNLPSDSVLEYILPTLVFKHGTSKYTIKFNPILTNPVSTEESKRLLIKCHVRYTDETIPNIENLYQDYKSVREYLDNYIITLFG